MSDEHSITMGGGDENVAPTSIDKGKGRAIEPSQDLSMDEDEESSSDEEEEEEEEEDEDHVRSILSMMNLTLHFR